MFNFFKIKNQVPAPQRSSLSNRRWLSRLHVRESETGKVTICDRKFRQPVDHLDNPATYQKKTLADLNQFCIVRDIATGRSQMNIFTGGRTLLSPCMNVCHHIVTKLSFETGGNIKINIVSGAAHFVQLHVSDMQSKFLLRLRQCNPQPPPGGMFFLSRPDSRHFSGRITGVQRVTINFV